VVLDWEYCMHEQVFDVGSRAVLRQLKGHQRPVHVARFSPDKLHVLSGGDDATV
jgi:U3 small nucleolar RNA-associated protein 15